MITADKLTNQHKLDLGEAGKFPGFEKAIIDMGGGKSKVVTDGKTFDRKFSKGFGLEVVTECGQTFTIIK